MQGKAEQNAANAEAHQQEINAGQERAVGQYNAAIMREAAKRLLSKQRAGLANSGFDATDATSRALISDTVQTSTLGEELTTVQAEERARQMEFAGKMSRYGGANAKNASYFKAGATLLQGLGQAAGSMPPMGSVPPVPA